MENDDLDCDQNELEEQFILRLPSVEAQYIRTMLRSKPEKVKKNLKIDLNVAQHNGSVLVGKKKLHAYLRKLPTIVESYKTNIGNDHANLYKTADLCHILECHYQDVGQLATKLNGWGNYQKIIDNFRSVRKDMRHGYTLPLKNVKKKRFRKTLVNPDLAEEVDAISKELYYLLSTDLEAIYSRFEIIYEAKSATGTGKNSLEKNLFGAGLTSDSESE